ncbi:MAG: DUF357 domain-containing protein [Archaeoglobaceae archaeon]|nr:DUF357 domain-containing protein [Archaeoglobaceae archaeon]MCX8152274.1 DUF357 domain-containing protein [Archaeoglobaceae archaeon]MDW8013952.1 DUF357 domain-containing protein [Archaeoglobaceae archaeon]
MLSDELISETLKMLEKIKKKSFEGEKKFVENIKAYVNDSEYFLKKGDLIKAFECIVWAWAWLEIGLEIGVVRDAAVHGDRQGAAEKNS